MNKQLTRSGLSGVDRVLIESLATPDNSLVGLDREAAKQALGGIVTTRS
jgi:hypothetical protein